ncbi:uncharacterized protein [Cardiocondyla obscurior]|uniref:uncharacterized protein n=1 Tax=Cardiocondyla obscurior TaxID=286306 RepID=UPI003965875E
MVYIYTNKHKVIKCRALLDTCASANFISQSAINRLGIRPVPQTIPISAINNLDSESRGIVRITIQSIYNDFRNELTCLTLPTIADMIPSDIFSRESITIPQNLKLADPEFHLPRPIDLLIGSCTTLSLFSIGQINISEKGINLYLQKTRLGWVIAGRSTTQQSSKITSYYLNSLETQLNKFWTIEEVASKKIISTEDQRCETHFLENVSRNSSEQYIVRLPFRESNPCIGDSQTIAHKQLLLLERKLKRDPVLHHKYSQIIKEYQGLGHMSVIDTQDNNGYYMSHHAVFKKSNNTTKTRIVFDASAKSTSGVSLNDVLMIGPTIQEKLFLHLIRFRTYNYVMTADIEKMYRQVLVHKDDRKYQRILWQENNTLKTLQLNTLTFGISSLPYLAIRTLHKLADDEGYNYPKAAHVLKSHLYVDDLLTGADSVKEF